MQKNKVISLLLICFLSISSFACGSKGSDETLTEDSNEIETPSHEPGPYMDGYDLHYADENGHDYKNCIVGFLQFDENGIYTSGDKDLDSSIREILEENIDPKYQSRIEMLRSLYNYVRDNNAYGAARSYDVGETGWEKDVTIEMLGRGSGNCFSYSGLYVMLSRAVGYQAEGVSGKFRGGPHSWVETIIDGQLYYSDPQYEATANQEYGLFNVGHDENVRQIQEYHNPNRDMSKIGDPVTVTIISDSIQSSESNSSDMAENMEIAKTFIEKDVEKLIDKIGEPISKEYGPSCYYDNAEEGVLEYDGFTVFTYKFEDKEIVNDVY